MFKATWARLCVCSGVCTAECASRTCALPSARAYARPSVRAERMHGRVHGRVLERMHGTMVRDDGRTVRWFVRLGSDIHFARLGWARGSVGRGARLGRDVSTVRGRDARIGCTRAKLDGHD